MREAKAYCPASLSFIFKFVPNYNIYRCGSVGVGCTVDKKVKVSVSENNLEKIYFNGKKITFPTVSFAVKKLIPNKMLIKIESPLTLGCGFGISGAATLATIYALKNYFDLEISYMDLAKIAHQSEIENKTGLGTVATQITGGFLIKRHAGIPVDAKRINLTGIKLYAVIFGSLPTPSILTDKNKLKVINQAANKALNLVNKLKQKTIDKILDISYQYCIESGLLTSTEVIALIEKIRKEGGSATMAILGQVVIANIKPPVNYRIEELIITDDTVKLL